MLAWYQGAPQKDSRPWRCISEDWVLRRLSKEESYTVFNIWPWTPGASLSLSSSAVFLHVLPSLSFFPFVLAFSHYLPLLLLTFSKRRVMITLIVLKELICFSRSYPFSQLWSPWIQRAACILPFCKMNLSIWGSRYLWSSKNQSSVDTEGWL